MPKTKILDAMKKIIDKRVSEGIEKEITKFLITPPDNFEQKPATKPVNDLQTVLLQVLEEEGKK